MSPTTSRPFNRPLGVVRTLTVLSCAILLVDLVIPQTASGQNPKSISTAKRASTLSTFIPLTASAVALVVSEPSDRSEFNVRVSVVAGLGLIFGPSVGHYYAGNATRFWSSSTLRLLLAGSTAIGIGMMAVAANQAWEGDEGSFTPVLFVGGIVVSLASLSLLFYSATKDYRDLDKSVSAYNQKHGLMTLRLEPTYSARQKAAGLALTLRS